MLYIPIQPLPGQTQTAEELAKETSRKIYQLSTTDPGTTQYYCRWIVHPSGQNAVLELPEADTLPIAITSKQYDILDSLLQPFEDAKLIPAGSVEDMRSRIEYRVQQGIESGIPQQINIFDMLPDFWKQQVLSYDDLVKGGWFPDI
jgi:hypothetical protein